MVIATAEPLQGGAAPLHGDKCKGPALTGPLSPSGVFPHAEEQNRRPLLTPTTWTLNYTDYSQRSSARNTHSSETHFSAACIDGSSSRLKLWMTITRHKHIQPLMGNAPDSSLTVIFYTVPMTFKAVVQHGKTRKPLTLGHDGFECQPWHSPRGHRASPRWSPASLLEF